MLGLLPPTSILTNHRKTAFSLGISEGLLRVLCLRPDAEKKKKKVLVFFCKRFDEG